MSPLARVPAALLLLGAGPARAEEPALPPCAACHQPSATPPVPAEGDDPCKALCKDRYFTNPEGMHGNLPCVACHAATAVATLPHGPGARAVDCAGTCHAAQDAVVQTTAHRTASLRAVQPDRPLLRADRSPCLTCHPPHAGQGFGSAMFEGVNPRSQPCLACHSDGRSSAPQVHRYEHPVSVFEGDGPRWAALESLPLFGRDGRKVAPGERGALTCNSCHSNHGPDVAPEHLRRPGWQRVCAACHGPDSLVLYRYFHRPERRAHIDATAPTPAE